jgi:asparagine synthase (glutamine-hydrolysing)
MISDGDAVRQGRDVLERAVWHCESPTTLSAAAKFLLSRVTRDRGVEVVLTVEGADDVYAGYSAFKIDNEAEQTDVGVVLDHLHRQLGFVPVWIRRAHRPIDYADPALSEEFRDWEPSRKFLDDSDMAAKLVRLHPLNISLYLWSKIRLLHFFLAGMADRTEMAHSVEGRTPYLDHELVEFGCTLPTSLKIRNGTEKFLLRECVRPVVTKELYRRPKSGFVPPIIPSRDRLLQLYRDTLSSSHAADPPFYFRPVMTSLLDRVMSGRTP